MEETENKKLIDLTKKFDESLAKLQDFGEINDSNVDEYYRLKNEGISQEELDEIFKRKVDRLILLWRQAIEELEKLDEILLKITPKLPPAGVKTLNIAQAEEIAEKVGLAASLHTFIGGVGTSLANLEGDDSKSQSLAVVSSGARQEILADYLETLSKWDVPFNLKPLQELCEKLRLVLGVMQDF